MGIGIGKCIVIDKGVGRIFKGRVFEKLRAHIFLGIFQNFLLTKKKKKKVPAFFGSK